MADIDARACGVDVGELFEVALHLGMLDAVAKALLAFFADVLDLRTLRARAFFGRALERLHLGAKRRLALVEQATQGLQLSVVQHADAHTATRGGMALTGKACA